jgi:hypothetical protein
MRPIDKFILHVVYNLFPLNEYSQGEMKFLMDKFKEEAEDLNIQISDEQLKKYIERFDQLKNNPKVTEKDLRKYSLSKLIQLVTSSPGAELPKEDEKEDDTPDVVYSDNGITIWNGAKQGNCIVYGASQKLPGGRKWCITEPNGSYWGTYRYGQSYGYPTFYLAKNDNLPDNNILSFVSLQVLDDGNYKFTNRANDPGMEGPFSWEELNRRVPWLKDIPNLKNILKYIPFSKSEKESEVYRNNPISIKQWAKEPFNTKKQYLQIRGKSRQLFSDISNELFISKYLPKYPEVANMVARTSGIIDVDLLIKYLDRFSKQEQSSIAQQIRDKVELSTLKEDISFDLKKYLVKTNKIKLDSNERLYVTKDNQSIVLLTLGENIKIGLYTEDDYYPNIKLNQRTSKYLLEYPELDKIPLRNLIKLSEDNIVSKEFVSDVLDKAKKDPNSALIVKPTEEGEIILDSNTFSSYRVGSDGKISSIPFDNEEVQQVLSDSKDNEGLQQNALNLFKIRDDLPGNIDKRSLVSIINSIPYNQRIMKDQGGRSAVLLTNAEGDRPFFFVTSHLTGPFYSVRGSYNTEGRFYAYGDVDNSRVPAYHAYLRSNNKSFSDAELMEIFRSSSIPYQSKINIVMNNMPVSADSVYKPVMNNTDVVLVNTRNSRESLMLGRSRNNLKQFNIPQQYANRLLGIEPEQPAAGAQPAAAGDQARRRGRPAGQPNAPRPAAAPAAAGDLSLSTITNQYNLTPGFNTLPLSILRKFRVNGRQVPVANDRGATRRQNILGNSGRVIAVYEFGPSSVYIIRTPNDGPAGLQTIASIVSQPGNLHYIVTNNGSYPLGSPRELLQVLQRRNLAEIHQYLVNEYMGRNPEHLNEFKELLRKHINEKKNEQK